MVSRQSGIVILQRKETNEKRPTIALAFCVEAIPEPYMAKTRGNKNRAQLFCAGEERVIRVQEGQSSWNMWGRVLQKTKWKGNLEICILVID